VLALLNNRTISSAHSTSIWVLQCVLTEHQFKVRMQLFCCCMRCSSVYAAVLFLHASLLQKSLAIPSRFLTSHSWCPHSTSHSSCIRLKPLQHSTSHSWCPHSTSHCSCIRLKPLQHSTSHSWCPHSTSHCSCFRLKPLQHSTSHSWCPHSTSHCSCFRLKPLRHSTLPLKQVTSKLHELPSPVGFEWIHQHGPKVQPLCT
jgi:hypothetical protein